MSRARRVLVADDNRDAADSLGALVEALGHSTRVAYDGSQAYVDFLDFRPHVSILDVQMPHMDGCDAAERMRASGRPTGVIASLTGMPRDQEPMRPKAGVFDTHLTKPADFAEIERLLAGAVRDEDGSASAE